MSSTSIIEPRLRQEMCLEFLYIYPLRYRRGDFEDDVEDERPMKRVLAKVICYALIIPLLKCLFRSKEHPS